MTIINSRFFFISIGASLGGFHASIRSVITIDETFFKEKYLGTLFIVVTP